MAKLRKIISNQEFNPGFLGLFVNPCYHARKGLSDHVRILASNLKGIVLDIGCGQKPYEKYIKCDRYIGLEMSSQFKNNKHIEDVRYDGISMPFKNNSLNGIIATQVIEHVPDPDNMLSEIKRILKPGGLVLLTAPFVWNEHEQPNDYLRYTSYGIKYVIQKHGFEIIHYEKILPDFRAIAQIMNIVFCKITANAPNIIRISITCALIAFVNIMGILLKIIMPKCDDFYLDNILLMRKK